MDVKNALMTHFKYFFKHIEFNENDLIDKMKERIIASGNYGRFITFDKFEKWFDETIRQADKLLNHNYNNGGS